MQLILHSLFTLYCLTVQTYAAALKFIVNINRVHILKTTRLYDGFIFHYLEKITIDKSHRCGGTSGTVST
jgi:hypothetical protein